MDTQEIRNIAGTKLKEIRKRKGLSTFKVGSSIGITSKYIRQVEHGISPVSDASLSCLADLYQVERSSLFDLYGRIENKEINPFLDNPAIRQLFTQVTSNTNLSKNDMDAIIEEFKDMDKKYFNGNSI